MRNDYTARRSYRTGQVRAVTLMHAGMGKTIVFMLLAIAADHSVPDSKSKRTSWSGALDFIRNLLDSKSSALVTHCHLGAIVVLVFGDQRTLRTRGSKIH